MTPSDDPPGVPSVPPGAPPVVGIIPAAGASSRMGTAKALLDADGRTFLERVVAVLVGGGCRSVMVVVEDPRSPVAAMALRAGAIVVENPDPGEGPITSLRRAVAALPEDAAGCALCPVDHPLVQAQTVALLLHAFRERRAAVTVPTWLGRRGHPVILRRDVAAELLDPELPDGARTVVRRRAALGERLEVPVEDGGVVVDIDTLPEYRRRFPAAYRKRFQSR